MNIITGSINGILVKLHDTNIIPMHWTRTFTNHCDRGSDWSFHSSAGGSSACVVPSASSVGAGASAATSSSASSAGTSSSSAEGRKEAMSKLTHWCLKNNGCQLADNISLERRCIYLVRLSVCGQNRVRSVSSTILIGSISYLHIFSSNLRRCLFQN